jgi:hypothetical protein
MKKPCLIFLLAPTEIWPKEYVDSETGENGGGARIEKLRDELSNRMCSLFTTPHNLVEMAQAAVHLTAVDAKSLALPDDPNSASCLSMKGSGVAGIITDISRVIKEEIKADIAKVNLGSGRSWWSTRLHLFSALCADYTDVRQLLFETEEYRFLGMCKPSQARRFLAQSFQNVEIAYRESLPPPGFNPADEVSPIVDQFSIAMDKLGGEQNVMRWVEPHLIQNWPGVNKDCVEMPVEGVTPALLKSVVGCQTPFVVLVRNGIILKIVDRTALATRIALIAIGRTGG